MKHSIVLVSFPFDDFSSQKVRPALCLTDPIGTHRHVVLAFITSRVPQQPLLSDLVIKANETEFPVTGLRVSSAIQLHRVMTVNVSIIRRKLGELPPSLIPKAKSRLRDLFGL